MRISLLLLLFLPFSVQADPARLAQLVDYVGVDYSAAVDEGQVISELEYNEMTEFSRIIREQVDALPEGMREQLEPQAKRLQDVIAAKGPVPTVVEITGSMRQVILDSPALASTPGSLPTIDGIEPVYQQQCASCHGANGMGDGPAGAGMDPAPTDFTDTERARARTIYGLYNTIKLGVDGTGMRAYSELSDEQRWALAFYVSGMHADSTDVDQGEEAFSTMGPLDKPELRELTTQTLAEVSEQASALRADVHLYLRRNPQALEDTTSPIAVAMAGVKKARDTYAEGKPEIAYDAAVDAYLEGFELAEASVSTTDSELVIQVEKAMTALRQGIRERQSVETVNAAAEKALGLLQQASDRVEGETLSAGIAFSSALIIILREGLEAILILGAIAAFLRQTGHREAMPWLHAGWIGALVVGVLTWVVSEFVLTISGATRELTEGITALLAAGILFYVGFWMHSKLNAARWQQFIKEKIQMALDSRTLYGITIISFIAVYREVFETVLFFQALWAQVGTDGSSAVTGGFVTGIAIVAVAAWAIFQFGVKLPLKQFFGFSAAVMILLAIVFAGKGVMALQEAGLLPINALDFDPIGWLGIYPSVQSITAQLVVVAAAAALILYNGRSSSVARS
ncbi:MAG: cytochrome c/FTR1 family iron permease [Gammaproteobacteria bacterium]|nr:cytochrome c/FTR1 family iron permease [Gammaproteobacteria bacterium]